jgi:hypothetical protein
MKLRCLVYLALSGFLAGCSSSGDKGLQVGGVDPSEIHGYWNYQTGQLGYPDAGKGKRINVQYSATSGSNGGIPYTCDENGCWHGLAWPSNGSQYHIRYPQGVPAWVKSHETLHCVDFATGAGVEGTEVTPGHPKYFQAQDGHQIDARVLVQGRWPTKVWRSMKAMLPGGVQPQDPWDNHWEEGKCFWENGIGYAPNDRVWNHVPDVDVLDDE